MKLTNNPEKKRIKRIFDLLYKEYPSAESALEYQSPFQLLIATILSAQCSDIRVNLVTKILFKKYKEPEDFIKVNIRELEKDIFSTGFYRQKARSVKGCCDQLIRMHNGLVPKNFDDLIKLPGVGRKTASVVLGNAFGIPAIAVDTHVKRLSNLLGFINSQNPEIIENQLKKLLPEDRWINSSHWLAMHGRNICIARKPKCSKCVLGKLCPSYKTN
jgi:endonuclease-3